MIKKISIVFFVLLCSLANAQFYNGHQMEFGKSRIQYEQFDWVYYQMPRFNVYYYTGGEDLAEFVARSAEPIIENTESNTDYFLDDKLHFIIYNKLEHLHQSNIGLKDGDENSLGGVSTIIGNKVFLYFNGNHEDLKRQIGEGVADIIVQRVMYGDDWKDIAKNSALLTIPDWYQNGLKSYLAREWNPIIDNRVRDLVMSGRYKKFNKQTTEESNAVGYALWNYIERTYGKKVVPNVLYMTRVSKNIESGFLFVLGVSLSSLLNESFEYYHTIYAADENTFDKPFGADTLSIKQKKNRRFADIGLSPDESKAAYSTIELGQKKVFLYDVEKEKSRRIYKQGFKLVRVNEDNIYPILAWHPTGKYLSVIDEKKGQIMLTIHNFEDGSKVTKPILRLEKILSAQYSDDGKKMVFSAVSNGQSDIFVYTIASNSQVQLTNDIYDDLTPAFTKGGQQIVFSSNRENDTLKMELNEYVFPNQHFDLFLISVNGKDQVLSRLTKTDETDEFQPFSYGNSKYTYLSDKNGFVNRYKSTFDSTISHIDTTVHYRFFTVENPVTNYNRNIEEHSINHQKGYYTEMVRKNSSYLFLKGKSSFDELDLSSDQRNTDSKESQFIKQEAKDKPTSKYMKYAVVSVAEIKEKKAQKDEVNIYDYTFDGENPSSKDKKKTEDKTTSTSVQDRFIEIQSEEKKEFQLPQKNTYHLNFTTSDLKTNMNFQFANDMYQWFNGGPYFNPGMGVEMKTQLTDLFENHCVEGGIRLSTDGDSWEQFLSYTNRKKKVDKKYTFQRQVLKDFLPTNPNLKLISIQPSVEAKYPFNEVFSFRGNVKYRHDNFVMKAVSDQTLRFPEYVVNWGGLKGELVFDNNLDLGINMPKGGKVKVFFETFKFIHDRLGDENQMYLDEARPDMNVAGIDARNYMKLHKHAIFASRLAASTSFGPSKLVYYMGYVDQPVKFSGGYFNYETAIANNQGYLFQALATPMRGFLQNTRNGNNFILINNEVRVALFKYFYTRPIKSEFMNNFQMVLFSDIGTAWTGKNPYSDENSFNSQYIYEGPLTIILRNRKDPIISSYGIGIRTKLLGYFAKFDYAFPVEDYELLQPKLNISLGLDF